MILLSVFIIAVVFMNVNVAMMVIVRIIAVAIVSVGVEMVVIP